MRIRYALAGLLAAAIVTALVAALPQGAVAATLTVDTLSAADNNADGDCSLREAIIAANNDADYNECDGTSFGNDTITFSVSGTVALSGTGALPAVTDADGLTIDGGGVITIDAGNASRIFAVNAGASLTLQDLGIQQGVVTGDGGLIHNAGTLVVSGSTLQGGLASTGRGGGIFNASTGSLTIMNSTIGPNQASGNGGGGIYNAETSGTGGTVIISDSLFTGNAATPSGNGGAIRTDGGTVTINDTTFTNTNQAGANGGAIASLANATGSVTITNSTHLQLLGHR
jgi:CSLREA domain-containing protein